MSLASLLLGKQDKARDADLDALFARTKVELPPPSAIVPSSAQPSTSKTKIAPPEEIIKQARIAKARAGARGGSLVTEGNKNLSSSKKQKKEIDSDPAPNKEKSSPSKSSKKRSRNDSNAGDTTTHSIPEASSDAASNDEADEDEDLDEESEDDDGQPLIHESLLAAKNGMKAIAGSTSLQTRAKKAAKYAGESKIERDARTTFVGNVPVICATNKSSKKALVRHLIATLPSEYQSIAKLDTIRFRSLQLATPAFTNDGRDTVSNTKSHSRNAEDDDDEEEEEEEEDKPDNHARKRARRWKSGELDSNTDGSKKKKIQFLTAAQKKKIGAIKGQVHEKASSCIAYLVWDVVDVVKKQVGGDDDGGDKSSSKEKKEKNKEKEQLDLSKTTPQEIASLVVKYGNNTIFEGFTLRLDHVKGSSTSTLPANEEEEEEGSNKTQREIALEQKARLEEEKRTLYIGSLDFEEKEQSIRELCENLMIEERGQPPKNDDGTKEAWVERVRLVRDPETGLGKGFAYVMFKDRECVDEMLALDSTRVKLSKRKLRLERCKTMSAKAAAANKAAKEAAQAARKEKQSSASDKKNSNTSATRGTFFNAKNLPPVPATIKPKAPRPDIGDQLKTLSKEERKALKQSDDERLARRLEKKQAKREQIKIEKQKEILDRKVKSAGGSAYKARIDPAKEGMLKKKNKRMRSDNAVFAKNRKKAT